MADAITEVAPAEEPLPVPSPLPVRDTVELPPQLPPLSSDASCEFSGIPTDASSNNASFISTPPTTLTDAASIASETSKPDITSALATPTLAILDDPIERIEQTVRVGTPQPDRQTPQPPASADNEEELTPRRARSARSSTRTPVYNLAKLAGTYIHGKRRANGDDVRDKRRRASAGDSTIQHSIDALDTDGPRSGPNTPQSTTKNKKEKPAPAIATRLSTRSSGSAAPVISVATSLGKNKRNSLAKTPTRVPRELKRLQDTNEFVGIEVKTVLHTIWSNGKYIDPKDLDEKGEPVQQKPRRSIPKKQPVVETASEEPTPTAPTNQKRVKKWLNKGLYAGQDSPSDWTTGLTTADKKKLAQLPEVTPPVKPNKTLPLPMFTGLRLLVNGRDFKLPFDVCNPLPPGQPKPDEWRKMTKSECLDSDLLLKPVGLLKPSFRPICRRRWNVLAQDGSL